MPSPIPGWNAAPVRREAGTRHIWRAWRHAAAEPRDTEAQGHCHGENISSGLWLALGVAIQSHSTALSQRRGFVYQPFSRGKGMMSVLEEHGACSSCSCEGIWVWRDFRSWEDGRSSPKEPEHAVPRNCGVFCLLDDAQRMSLPFAEHSPSPAPYAGTPKTLPNLVFTGFSLIPIKNPLSSILCHTESLFSSGAYYNKLFFKKANNHLKY